MHAMSTRTYTRMYNVRTYHRTRIAAAMASLGSWGASLRRRLGMRPRSPAVGHTDTTDGPTPPDPQTPESQDASKKETSGVDESATLEALHNAMDEVALVTVLKTCHHKTDVNTINHKLGLAPIHSIVRRKQRNRLQLLLALLVHSNVDVNLAACDGNTPLHMIVREEGNDSGVLDCTKALICFGAKVNLTNAEGLAPLDLVVGTHPSLSGRHSFRDVCLATDMHQRSSSKASEGVDHPQELGNLYTLLKSVGGLTSESCSLATLDPRLGLHLTPTQQLLVPLEEDSEEEGEVVQIPELQMGCLSGNSPVGVEERRRLYLEGEQSREFYMKLEENLNVLTAGIDSIRSFNETYAMVKQKEEISRFQRTGQRVLCLDGGGMKGLVQIEILNQIEEVTGKKIVDLFDYIVATSTGAVVALGIVYAKKPLSELRQLYFRLKDEVFANPKFGVAFNTQALETTLKAVFGTEAKMSDITYPRVLVAAVNKEATPLQLHFFNNCFEDAFSSEYVWKVARRTSAAPVFFSECDNYVDGGVLANNPCQYGLDEIQKFHQSCQQKIPISLVVSVGTGTYPREKLGHIDPVRFLLPGMHWLKFRNAFKAASNLLQLFSDALVESEMLVGPCRQLCLGQGIKFFRFSPQLDDVIPAGETDNGKLLQMVITTKKQTQADINKLCNDLV